MPYADIRGASIWYEDVGAGDEAVILLHGWLNTGRIDFDPEVREWLAPRYRVILPDLRGYGRSGPKPRTYGWDFYRRDALDMAALLDRIGITRAHVFGFSDGGEVAILMAVERPDLVRSVAAWGAVGYFGEEMRPRIQRTYPPTWADAETRARNGSDAFEGVVLGWVNGMKAYIDAGGSVSRHQAARIACPVLLMLGDGDSLNPIPVGQALADQIPAGQLAIFENCGHAIHREKAGAFRAAVDDFLRAVN